MILTQLLELIQILGTMTNNNTFMWVILAAIAIAIIALVWYYGVQTQNHHGRNNF